MPDFRFDAGSHTYTLDGRVLPSVTKIIEPLYDGILEGVSAAVLNRKRDLGIAVHLACEYDDQGRLDEESLSDEIRPYVEAWRKFKREKSVVIIATEQQLYHPVFMFAGTVDNIVVFDGSYWVLDRKTTYEIHRPVGVQLAGYALLAEHDYERTKRGALRLLDDGTYRLVPFNNNTRDDDACFRGMLATFHWKRKYLK